MMWRLIWVCALSPCPIYGTLGLNGLKMIFLELDSLLLSPFHFIHWGKQRADVSYGKCVKEIFYCHSFFLPTYMLPEMLVA